MLKMLGAVLLFWRCFGLGLIQIRRMDSRINVLKMLVFSLEAMEREITFRLPAMEVMLREAAAGTREPVAGFLIGCSTELEKGLQKPFQEMWSNMALQKLSVLKKSDFDSLLALGGVLGRYDAEGQRDAIGHACASLEHSLLTATEERRNQGKVYGTLSATAGAFLVILLL